MALNLLIDEYSELLVEFEHMNLNLRTLHTTLTPSFEDLMRVEYIQEKMYELYHMMLVVGLRAEQSQLDNALRKRMYVYKL